LNPTWKHQASGEEQVIASALTLLPAKLGLEEADPLVSHIKEGAERNLAAETLPTRANYSPTWNVNTRKVKVNSVRTSLLRPQA